MAYADRQRYAVRSINVTLTFDLLLQNMSDSYTKIGNILVDFWVFHAFPFWATVCKTVHPMLSNRCLYVLSVTSVYGGQTVGPLDG